MLGSDLLRRDLLVRDLLRRVVVVGHHELGLWWRSGIVVTMCWDVVVVVHVCGIGNRCVGTYR